jgi:hypothetical protein
MTDSRRVAFLSGYGEVFLAQNTVFMPQMNMDYFYLVRHCETVKVARASQSAFCLVFLDVAGKELVRGLDVFDAPEYLDRLQSARIILANMKKAGWN